MCVGWGVDSGPVKLWVILMGMPGEVREGTPLPALFGSSSQAALGGTRDEAEAGTGIHLGGGSGQSQKSRLGGSVSAPASVLMDAPSLVLNAFGEQ